jgi:hypothetical protein
VKRGPPKQREDNLNRKGSCRRHRMTPKKTDSKESLTIAQTKDKKVTAEEEKKTVRKIFF